MAKNVTVYFADGSQHVYQNVPDTITPDQVIARAGKDFSGRQIRHVERSSGAAPEAERTLGGYAKETLKGLGAGLVGLGETAVTGAAALLPEEPERAVREAVTGVTQPAREYLAPAAGYEDTVARKLSEAVGSTLPFLPLGALGLAGRAAATGLGVAAGAGEARQRAEQEEVTEGERGLATALGTIPGALESLPPIRILRRFGFGDEAIQEVAGFVPALTRVAKAGGEEALQEASSQVLQNLIAKGVYKPEEAVFGGVGEAAAMGGGAGAVVSAIAELALGRRLRGPEAEREPAAPIEEEAEVALTPEELAPKAAIARPSPIRAKTAEELGIAAPPAVTKEAPLVEEPKIEAFQVPSAFNYYVTNTPAYEGVDPLSADDADFELEVLEEKAKKGKLTTDVFANSEIGQRLDTAALMTVNEGIKADPVATIQSLRQNIQQKAAAAQPAVTEGVPSEPVRGGVGEVVAGAAPRGAELPVQRGGPARPEITEPAVSGLEPVSTAAPRVDEGEAVEPTALEPVRKLPDIKTQTVYRGGPRSTLASFPANVTAEDVVRYEIEELGNAETIKAAPNIDLKTIPANQLEWVTFDKKFAERYADVDAGETVEGREETFRVIATDADGGYLIQRLPSTSEQRFLNLDRLNAATPAVPEQTKEKAPSLRRELSKAKSQYDVGKMTADDFANRAGQLLLKTQKERVIQPRQRGAEFIRERLFNAVRRGELPAEGVELASWFIQQNPALVSDLGISITKRPESQEGVAGYYNDVTRVIKLFKEAADPDTATHEILHHLERLMPTNIRAGIYKAYTRQLLKAQKNAKTSAEKAFFDSLVSNQFGQLSDFAYQKALQDIKTGKVSRDNYQYINPSEFWAVNGTRIVRGRYGVPPTITGQLKRWLREFIEKVKSALGLKSDAAVIRALDSLAKADGKYQTSTLLMEAPQYLSVEPTKAGKIKKPVAGTVDDIVNLRRQASDKIAKPGIVKQTIQSLTSKESSYEKLVKNFQDDARYIKKLENDLRAANRLEYIGEKKNAISSVISTAANKSSFIVATEVEPTVQRLKKSILAYAEATKLSVKDALERAEAYFIALHEAERRETKYLCNVPLNNTTKLEFLPGEGPMTAADARTKLEERRSLAKTDAEAAAILERMRYLAANYADPRGFSPVKAKLEDAGKPTPEEMTTDYYDKIYNVIGPEYTQEALEATRNEYNSLPAEQKQFLDQIKSDLDAVHELNKNLNRRANYWTDKVDRVIASYGWKNYVPFKGSPRADKSFDTDTEFLSGELSETPESFEGRRTNFDSPILQTIAESYFAASRAGRGTEVTQTIKNLIDLGVIKTKTKKPKIFTFEERNAPDFDYNQVRGRDKVLHYNEDGSVEVYSIENPEALEAIKKPYREMNWATKLGNTITSSLGQMHTRFNPAFPPMDFIRNSLTNASLIAAREGGAKAREYIAAVSANVARNGIWKSGKLSKLLSNNDTAEIERLAKSGDPFYQDAIDMMRLGGRTMYRMSFNISDMMEELSKQLGPDKIIKDPNQMLKYVDAYNDAFELTSRVAAYSVRKAQNIAEAQRRKPPLDINDPAVMEDIKKEAASFALSLMDFRKIGKYGREMGAWFMFIRPAATGAVDAIDALRPAFQTPQKIYDRLSPEVKELFETNTLAEEVQRLQKSDKPDAAKIAKLQAEIASRQKAFKDFEARQVDRIKTARAVMGAYIALGAALYTMAAAIAGDDDEGRNRVATDDMSRWTRYLRLPIIGDEGFFQIPWGFGVSGLAAFGAQSAALARGNSNFKEFLGNSIEIGIDSYLPIPASRINPFDNFGAWLLDSATPSAARPLVEYLINVDAMGNPIYNSRAGKYSDAFSGSSRPSEIHRVMSQFLFNMSNGKLDVSPDTIAFMLNNYADAPNHFAENSWNLALTAMGDKQFDAKKDTFVLRSFIGRNSNYDARKFAEAEKEIKELSRRLKTIEDFGTPEQLERFLEEHPTAEILIDTYNSGVNGELRKLQQEKNEIRRDPSLTPKERKELLDDILIEENYIKKGLTEDFEAYKG